MIRSSGLCAYLRGGGLVAEDGLARWAVAGGGRPEVASRGGDLVLQNTRQPCLKTRQRSGPDEAEVCTTARGSV